MTGNERPDGKTDEISNGESRQELIGRVMSLFRAVMALAGSQDMRDILRLDLTMPQMKVLAVLWQGGPSSVKELALALGVALPTMTGILDRLVEHGLVMRYESPDDRRLVISKLTDEGAATIAKLRQAGLEHASNVLRRLSTDDLQDLVRALDKLRSAAEQELQSRS